MNILIISQYFYPENFRINDLANYFIEKEHDITVLTGYPNYPNGKLFEGYSLFKNGFELYNKIKIYRTPIVPRGGSRFQLIINYLSFFISASFSLHKTANKHFDVILVYEPSPITVMIPAIIAKKKLKVPLYFWLLDLWPDSLIATKTTSNKIVIKSIDKLVSYFYCQSDKILISSSYFKEHILERNGKNEQLMYFPNWADKELEESSLIGTNLLPFSLPDGFKVIFAGNVGESQDFETLIEVAKYLKNFEDIKFIIIGEGRKLKWLKEQILSNKLEDRIFLFGSVTIDKVFPILNKADILYLSLRNERIFESTVPGKLQTYLLAGKPIVSAVNGETFKFVKENKVGIACFSGNISEISKAILEIKNMTHERIEEINKNNKKLYWKKFSRSEILNGLLKDMECSIYAKKT